MYLLYLDDSGSVQNPQDQHLVLAGFAVFERQTHWLSEDLDKLAARVWPDSPDTLEFRGSDILAGKKHWRGVPRETRAAAYLHAMSILGASRHVTVFGCAVHKASSASEDPMELAFENVCNRFDRYLGRLHNVGNTQRGLIILDKSAHETSLQDLARRFRTKGKGHRWGQLYNLCEAPLFIDSRATRMIQLADMVAHATRRYYENGEAALFDAFAQRFDRTGETVHGLVHCVSDPASCACLSCRRR